MVVEREQECKSKSNGISSSSSTSSSTNNSTSSSRMWRRRQQQRQQQQRRRGKELNREIALNKVGEERGYKRVYLGSR